MANATKEGRSRKGEGKQEGKEGREQQEGKPS
jgi:hypothetical protein